MKKLEKKIFEQIKARGFYTEKKGDIEKEYIEDERNDILLNIYRNGRNIRKTIKYDPYGRRYGPF